MKSSSRGLLMKHLTETERDREIKDAKNADETRLVQRLRFVKKLYQDDTRKEAGNHVGISRSTTLRWAHGWNEDGLVGLRPSFGGERPPKLIAAQFDELCEVLEDGQRWTPQQIHALIEDREDVSYHSAHLSRKLRAAGMKYAKPRQMDPRRPSNAEEILVEHLDQTLGEDDRAEGGDEPVVFGFF